MNIVVQIPDALATRLGASRRDLERQTLEAFVLESFRAGRIAIGDLREALGFQALDQVDGFLKAHGVYEHHTVADVDREVETLTRLGL